MRALALQLICLGAVVGCSLTGPENLKGGRGLYNVAIQQTNNEQMLLNLVRLRYVDTPFFLTVTSVSTSFTIEGSALAAGEFNTDTSTGTVGVGARVVSSPTVTYTPVQGEQFAERLLSPMELRTVLLLANSGWSIERVFRLCVRSIEGLQNAPRASGPTPKDPPVYERFLRAVQLLRHLQKTGMLTLAREGDADDGKLVLEISRDALDWEETREFTELLGLTPGLHRYRVLGSARTGPDAIGVVTRSLMGAFYYAAQGVDVPESDLLAGRAVDTRRPDGGRFDWRKFSQGLLQIHSGSERPSADVYVSVPYRSSWFYMSDSDSDAKATFSLLAHLFALSAGESPSPGPILTLPVGIGSVR